MRNLLILLAFIPCLTMAAPQVYLGLGLWTEHWYNDDSRFNEDSRMVQLRVVDDSQYFVGFSTFENSHYKQSMALSIGREYTPVDDKDFKIGLSLAAVRGYEHTKVQTFSNGLIYAPVSYIKYKYFYSVIFGPAINVGLELPL